MHILIFYDIKFKFYHLVKLTKISPYNKTQEQLKVENYSQNTNDE